MAASPAGFPLSSQAPDGAQVIARAGHVLRTLDHEDQGLSLAQLAERIGLPRSTMHRIVTALASEGMVAIGSPGGSVLAGPKFARLASPSEAEPRTAGPPFR
jgi:DNA-binding IclR family transcriptional regulator